MEKELSDSKETNGQSAFFDLWVDEHADVLYRFALMRTQNPTVAEDLVQETFVAALKSMNSFRKQSSLQTWLIGILKNKIIDHFRSQKRTISMEETDFSCDSANKELQPSMARKIPYKEWDVSPEMIVEDGAFRETLQNCLNRLPEKAKQLFLLREIEEAESTELCKIYSITPTNLWVMLHRIRHQLKSCLEKNWFNR